MIPRSQEDMIYYLRDLLRSKLKDLTNNLPVHLEWASDEAAMIIISYYLYCNNNNLSKTARDLGVARTTLSYHMTKHPDIKQEIDRMISEDKEYLKQLRKSKIRR